MKKLKCPNCERAFKNKQALSLHLHYEEKKAASVNAKASARVDVEQNAGDLTITVELQGVKIKASSVEELDTKVAEVLAPLRALNAFFRRGS